MHFLIPVTRGNVKHADDLTCAQNIGSLSFTPCHALWAKGKKVIATLLGRLTCHPMREQNLEAKYLEQADQWVPASQFAIQ